jgi:hypothetical protein
MNVSMGRRVTENHARIVVDDGEYRGVSVDRELPLITSTQGKIFALLAAEILTHQIVAGRSP